MKRRLRPQEFPLGRLRRMPTLAELAAVLDAAYPPALAESWDAVGLVCGDPAAEVRRVLFAVDPVESVFDEALEWGAGLLVTHHPLLLKPVHGVPAVSDFSVNELPAPKATVWVPVKAQMPFSGAQNVEPPGPAVTGPV